MIPHIGAKLLETKALLRKIKRERIELIKELREEIRKGWNIRMVDIENKINLRELEIQSLERILRINYRRIQKICR